MPAPSPRSVPPRSAAARRARGWVAAVAGVVLVTATAGVTVLVEHHIHGHVHDAHERGGDHAHGADRSEHGEEQPAQVDLTDAQLEAAGVTLAVAGPGKVVVTADLPGEVALNAEAMAHVGPRVGGTVRLVHKKLGDEVRAGDVLAVLDSRDVAEMLGEVQAQSERLKLARSTYERKQQLYEEKITSQKDYLEAKQAFAEAQVAVRSAQRALAAKTGGTSTGGDYALVAPLSGTIVGWHIGVGEVLEEDTRAFTIADLSSVWVNVAVYARNLPYVRVGQRALVRAEGIDAPAEGRISYLSQTVGQLTRSATARIVLTSPGEAWRPGLFVNAAVEIDEAEAAVVVPEGAVQRLAGKHVVFVRDGEHVRAQPVILGRHGHLEDGSVVVEIESGLRAGETFVADNSFLIKAELGKSGAGHEH